MSPGSGRVRVRQDLAEPDRLLYGHLRCSRTADDLEGGISGTYTPTAEDIGKCLRATASYTDPQGSDTAMSVLTDSDQPVEEDDTNKAPTFPDQDMEADGDQTDQERTVEENIEPNDGRSALWW